MQPVSPYLGIIGITLDVEQGSRALRQHWRHGRIFCEFPIVQLEQVVDADVNSQTDGERDSRHTGGRVEAHLQCVCVEIAEYSVLTTRLSPVLQGTMSLHRHDFGATRIVETH